MSFVLNGRAVTPSGVRPSTVPSSSLSSAPSVHLPPPSTPSIPSSTRTGIGLSIDGGSAVCAAPSSTGGGGVGYAPPNANNNFTKQPYEPRPPWAYDPLAITRKKRMTQKEYQELHHLTKLPTSVAKFRSKTFSLYSIEEALQNKINAHTSRDCDRFRQILRIFKEQAPKGGVGGEREKERREREEREREAEKDEKDKDKVVVTREEFATALSLLGMFATKEQADLLFDKYDENHDGILTIHEFLTRNRPKDYTEERWYEAGYLDERIGKGKKQFLRSRLSGSAARPNTPSNNVFYLSFNKICSGIRRKLTGKARSGEAMSNSRGRRELLKLFHYFDKHFSGMVDIEGLKKVFELLNFHIGKEKLEEVFNLFADPPLPILLSYYGYNAPPDNINDDDHTPPPSLPAGFSITSNRNFLYEKFIERVFPDDGKEDEIPNLTAPLSSLIPPVPDMPETKEGCGDNNNTNNNTNNSCSPSPHSLYDKDLTSANACNPATSLHLSHDAGKSMLERLDELENGIEIEKKNTEMEKRSKQVQKMWTDYWKRYGGGPPQPYNSSNNNNNNNNSSMYNNMNNIYQSSFGLPPRTPDIGQGGYMRKNIIPPLAPQTARPAFNYNNSNNNINGNNNYSNSVIINTTARPPSAPAAPFIYYPSQSNPPPINSLPVGYSPQAAALLSKGFNPLTNDGYANGFRPSSGASLSLSAQNSIRPYSQPVSARW